MTGRARPAIRAIGLYMDGLPADWRDGVHASFSLRLGDWFRFCSQGRSNEFKHKE